MQEKPTRQENTLDLYFTTNPSLGLCFFSKKNIPIPNVAEKNILILVEEKKIWFRVFVI